MTTVMRIGMLGCGVVGGGVVEALYQNADHMERQFGVRLELVRVVVRDVQRPRTPHFQTQWLAGDWREVTAAEDVDVVVEAMGGIHPAHEAVQSALRHGKHVVTANKELLAHHGEGLMALARKCGRQLLFEASVLGGIPALHALQTYFAANRITKLRGILNGTTNYILSRMTETGIGFAQALLEAQAAGFAEADPSADVDGYDALYKLKILIRQALATEVGMDQIERQGIAQVDGTDILFARSLGCKVKLIAEAAAKGPGCPVAAGVKPVMLGPKDPLYNVEGVQNALIVTGDLVGDLAFMGPGAGALPTASAVVEDVLKLVGPVPLQENQLVAGSASGVVSSAYLLRRPCEPGACSGASQTGMLAQALGAKAIRYLALTEQNQEAWVVSLDQELVARDLVRRAAEVMQTLCSVLPVYNLPEEVFESNGSTEVLHSSRSTEVFHSGKSIEEVG